MNRKFVVLAVALLAVAMLATPLVSAVPPKQTWHYVKTLNFITDVIVGGEREYYPSFENPKRMVITATENYLSFVITVGGNTYTMGVDFDVVGQVKMSFNNPTFAAPEKLYPASFETNLVTVDLFLDFYAYAGGIEGTLHLLELGSDQGQHNTYGLEGTGDLGNVHVMGVWESAFSAPMLTVTEDGTVINWPA